MARIMEPAEAWGRVFEVAVKRGVLANLIHTGLMLRERPELVHWRDMRTARLYASVRQALDWQDEARGALCDEVVRHLLVFGYGLGWTCLREWRKQTPRETAQVVALWCPLSLPGVDGDKDDAEFSHAFGFASSPPGLLRTGGPARSDFTALFDDRTGRHQTLLVLEISFNAPLQTPDFTTERAHAEELGRYARLLDLRGVFSHVRAEVGGVDLSLSPHLANHLTAFSGPDKPFLKLCQGASYATTTADILCDQIPDTKTLQAQVIAVTTAGFETLAADLSPRSNDPRAGLMRDLGAAYRRKTKIPDQDADAHLVSEISSAFNQLILGLPQAFRRQIKEMTSIPVPGEPIRWSFQETLTEFHRPSDQFSIDEALRLVPNDPDVDAFLGTPARSRLHPLL